MKICFYGLITNDNKRVSVIYKTVDDIVTNSYWIDYTKSTLQYVEGFSYHIGHPVKHIYEKETSSNVRKMKLDEVLLLFL